MTRTKKIRSSVDVLRRILSAFRKPGVWVKGSYATKKPGFGPDDFCKPNDPEARCFCLDGALQHAASQSPPEPASRGGAALVPPLLRLTPAF